MREIARCWEINPRFKLKLTILSIYHDVVAKDIYIKAAYCAIRYFLDFWREIYCDQINFWNKRRLLKPEERLHTLTLDSNGSIKEFWNSFKPSNSWVRGEAEVDCLKWTLWWISLRASFPTCLVKWNNFAFKRVDFE